MSRVQLEQLNVEGLRELAWQQNLDICGSRAVLLDRLADYFERNEWPNKTFVTGPSMQEDRMMEQAASVLEPRGARGNPIKEFGEINSMRMERRSSTNIQEIVQAVIQALDSRQNNPAQDNASTTKANGVSPVPNNGAGGVTFHSWNQVYRQIDSIVRG